MYYFIVNILIRNVKEIHIEVMMYGNKMAGNDVLEYILYFS